MLCADCSPYLIVSSDCLLDQLIVSTIDECVTRTGSDVTATHLLQLQHVNMSNRRGIKPVTRKHFIKRRREEKVKFLAKEVLKAPKSINFRGNTYHGNIGGLVFMDYFGERT